jgi:hypothetical protein
MVIENRFDRMDYLLETTMAFGDNPQALLEELVNAMSDREFHGLYEYICRMHDIEPDMDKFNKLLEESNYERALQGNSYPVK